MNLSWTSKIPAIKLRESLIEVDEELIMMIEIAFQQLVDRLYRENEEMMAPEQYEAAKSDFEYCLQLVELAIAYECSGSLDKDRRRLLS